MEINQPMIMPPLCVCLCALACAIVYDLMGGIMFAPGMQMLHSKLFALLESTTRFGRGDLCSILRECDCVCWSFCVSYATMAVETIQFCGSSVAITDRCCVCVFVTC